MNSGPILLRIARHINKAVLAENGVIYPDEEYLDEARALLDDLRDPTPQMINAGEAWRSHCSDTDSLWTEMVHAALHPESYPAEPHPLSA